MTKPRAALVLLAIALAGCVHVGKSVLTTQYQARPVHRDDVHVYIEGDSLPEHTRVAILDAKGDTDFTDQGDLVNALRREAGKLGANAIVLGDSEDAGTGAKVGKALLGTSANRKGGAIAIFVPSLSAADDMRVVAHATDGVFMDAGCSAWLRWPEEAVIRFENAAAARAKGYERSRECSR